MPVFRQRIATIESSGQRHGRGRFAWLLIPGLGLLIFALIKNYEFYESGLLDPDFAIIHRAFDFNFGLMPALLIGCACIGLILKLFGRVRTGLASLLFLFLAFDLWALRIYMTKIEPFRLKVREVQILTPKLTEPVRILHLSDIQAGSITEYEVKLFERIRALEPDIIINTGDYLQVVPPATFAGEFPKLMELVQRLEPRYGNFGVFGDTDLNLYRVSLDRLKPIEILSSRSRTIETSGGLISIHGLSLYESKHGNWALRGIDRWSQETDPAAFKILMGHAPDFAMEVANHPIDLCLAGHTHGGQVRLPFWGALVIDSKVPKEWSRGMTRIGQPLLNVSAGAGSNRYGGLPRLRFNCPTEVTLIELLPAVRIR